MSVRARRFRQRLPEEDPPEVAADEVVADRRPVFLRLRDRIAADIARNVWAPGEAISTEAEFAAQYDLSLGTVRRALDLLEGEGMVERIRGSGTFVRRPDFETAFIRFIRYYGSAGDRRKPHSILLSRDVLIGPPEVTEALQLAENAPVIRLLRQRTYEGLPVLIEEIWLEKERFVPVLEMKENRPRLLYPIYERLCGAVVAYTEETITIGISGKADVDHLGLVEGTPVVLIERLALGYDDVPIEWRRSRGPASDFRYKIVIR